MNRSKSLSTGRAREFETIAQILFATFVVIMSYLVVLGAMLTVVVLAGKA